MRIIIQRVSEANVKIDDKIVGEIQKGIMILFGACKGDGINEAEFLAKKAANLRIFEDENEKMNLSLLDIDAQALVVPNFTLYANSKKGNRPSFTKTADKEVALNLFRYFKQKLKEQNVKKVEGGEFGADMKVFIVNDGPVTIILDTDEIMPKK